MYIKRDIYDKFEKVEKVYSAVALVGARQAGKTTFLKEHVPDSDYSYLLFDDPDVRGLFEDDIKSFEAQYLSRDKISVLDEIHYCEDAGGKLKYLVDSGYKLWLTSSSEMILSEKVLSFLVGRVSVLRLFPFSLSEFLRARGVKIFSEKIIKRNVLEHMTYGGYPKVVLSEDVELKRIILRDIYMTMILKDVANTFSIGDVNSLERLVKYIAYNVGNVVSYEAVSVDLGMPFATIRKYLDACEKSHLIVLTVPFYRNKLKEIVKRPKIYFVDCGLRNAVLGNFDVEIRGNVFENYVLSELLKMGRAPKYWRTKVGAEVDFVVEDGGDVVPIEVKVSVRMGKVERSLRSFIGTYKPKRAFVVSYEGKKGEVMVGDCKVVFCDVVQLKELIGVDVVLL